MRVLQSPSVNLAWARALGAAALAGCGGGTAAVHLSLDGGADVAAEMSPDDGATDVAASDADAGPAPADAPAADADGESADVGSDADASFDDAEAPAAEHPADVAAEAAVDVGAEAPTDLPVEKPSATASWTIAPNPMCTAAGAGCMDTGTVGGYQITASGTCPTASSVQLWFPGGASPLAAGSYAVKAAGSILDVIAMPAGMVGVSAEGGGGKYWGRAGSVTVAAAGAGRHVTFSGVTLREETSSAMTTLAVDVSCP